jgi:hypothetical protein
MKHKVTLLLVLLLVMSLAQAQTPKKTPQLYQNEGIYYRDRAQNELYTGDYREYYDNNTLKLEMQIKTVCRKVPISFTSRIANRKKYVHTERENFMDYGANMTFPDSSYRKLSTKTGKNTAHGVFGTNWELNAMKSITMMATRPDSGGCGTKKVF